MKFENLSKLTIEEKKEILKDLIENDVSYWKKIMILMTMVDENEHTELLDLIIEQKIEEINLANKLYDLNLKRTDNSKNYASVMEKIINGSDDAMFKKACNEVLEILHYIPNYYYEKINKSFIEKIKDNTDNIKTLFINENTKFDDLNILSQTNQMLALISDKFWNEDGITVKINEIFNSGGVNNES